MVIENLFHFENEEIILITSFDISKCTLSYPLNEILEVKNLILWFRSYKPFNVNQ